MGFATCDYRADIGVFGGSGFYDFGSNVESVNIETPYGAPSDKISLVEIFGKRVAFLPRHGKEHQFSPTNIPYRANLWAMKALGVKKIIGPCAAGSLQAEVKPGSFVICDQFVDRTKHRQDTFFQGPYVTHLSAAEPYCPKLRSLAYQCAQDLNIEVHPQGTMVVIEGPRFSTKAESQWFRQMGWTVVNMTGYPECYLARELEMCYVNISLITDYDAGIDGLAGAVVASDVIKIFQENNHKVKNLIYKMIEKINVEEDCGCLHVVDENRF
ncbi:S-methyl-5'-thioadenosine phosphorylase [bacterium]|nr:S-methyl-5'-thioadenosine phosphorylase [bacterium]